MLARAADRLRARRLDEAVALLREAARLQPSHPLIHHDLGLALLEIGRPGEAVEAFRRAVAENPKYVDAFFRMGVAFEKLGDFRAALLSYDRATTLQPTLAEAWFRAGDIVYLAGRPVEAAGCFRRAAATGRKTRFGRLGAARALLIEERDQEAEKLLRQALAADPANAMALDLLGRILAEAGRFDEARTCFARAVALSPLLGGAFYDLARCRRLTPADQPLIAQMEAALAAHELEPAQRYAVHLARGKAADDLADYETAMRHFDAADATRRKLAAFDAAAFEAEVERLIERFSPAALANFAQKGSSSATPLLIVGMPRSGTTLVEQILSSHRDVAAGGELNFWNERGAEWRQAELPATDAAFLNDAAEKYLALLGGIGRGAARVTDKMPFNFLWAGLIHLAFPQARIIHCRRNAADTALSIHQTLFHHGLAFPTGGAELVAYFRSYRRLTEHWRRVLPPDRFLEVDYEKLTAEPEAVAPWLIEACGLTWDEACLRPERNPRPVRTPSKWQTRQPINQGSIGRWRRYQPWLGPLATLTDSEAPMRPTGATNL